MTPWEVDIRNFLHVYRNRTLGKSMRDIVLIFKRFRAQTEGFQQFTSNVPVGTTTGASNTWTSLPNKRKTHSKDAGAELFMNKTKKGKDRGNKADEVTLVQRACSISRALVRRVNEKHRGYFFILFGIDGVGHRNSTAQEALASQGPY
jgi:hypothetical protein